MIEFVGNCSHIIDWQEVVDDLTNQTPGYIGPRHREDDPIKGISDIALLWKNAGYKLLHENGTAGWDMFFPNVNFSESIVNKFSEFVGINPINAWISRVNPGMVAPWHWDANDNEEEYETIVGIKRFSCHISKPSPGHVFIVEDHCFYDQKQGDVYLWPSRKSWHGGANCGLVPKYLFNIFGNTL